LAINSQDVEILNTLLLDSGKSLTEIAEKVGLSRFVVKKRVDKLFKEGTLLGPTIVVNAPLVGFRRTVFFEFKTNPHEPWLAKLLEKTNSCDLLYGITGDYSLFARFRLSDDEHFTRVLKKIDDAMGKSVFKKYRAVNAIRIFKESGASIKTAEKNFNVDEIDLRILEILLNQTEFVKSPLPVTTVQLAQLLRRFGLEVSQPTVFQRLARLEKNGVIVGNTVRVDWNKLGWKTWAIVHIKADPSMYAFVAEKHLSSMNEITDLYRTGEEYGLLAIIRVQDLAEYNAFLLRLYDSKDIIDTYTTLVLEQRKTSPLSLKKD
jgi:Lrp/AsnC family transcriptional regulator for asnA, asnC and gidA